MYKCCYKCKFHVSMGLILKTFKRSRQRIRGDQWVDQALPLHYNSIHRYLPVLSANSNGAISFYTFGLLTVVTEISHKFWLILRCKYWNTGVIQALFHHISTSCIFFSQNECSLVPLSQYTPNHGTDQALQSSNILMYFAATLITGKSVNLFFYLEVNSKQCSSPCPSKKKIKKIYI